MTQSLHQPKLPLGHNQIRPGERVFVIAPLVAKPRPKNAHRYGGIASGPTYVESDPIGLKGGSYSTYSYVNSNPISNKDPLGLMCTPGVGCYTTPAEAAAAQSGNYLGYYQLACAGGDAYACFAQHIAANDSDWGHTATDWLLNKLHKKQGSCNDDETLKDIRTDLAKAYAAYLPNDPDNARWPDAGDIAELHWNVFGNYGLPPSTFGGTPLGQWGGLFLPGTWCPNCGGPRPFGAGMH